MKTTSIKLRNLTIYQIYVRNFSQEGTFNKVVEELDRIKALGVDVVYLLPIHPIGVKGKKGSLGCPYSIQDYREINPELGSLEDFKNLIQEVHNRDMKIMMDIVYNHTSRDSKLLQEHPEYFYRNENGDFANRVGEWSDVYDVDYSRDKGLWFELIDTLVYYANMGVDGFRCDVASMVPIDFWKKARKEVRKVRKNVIWLSESIHGYFNKELRDMGFESASESEIYQVFDMAYDYDVEQYYREYFTGKRPLKDYLEGLKRQDEIYPKNYVKMHNLENHDIPRIAKNVDNDIDKIKNWIAFNFFQKGAVMLYAGEEFTSDRQPSLFDKDVYNKNEDISDFIAKLTKLKKKRIFAEGIYTVNIPETDGVAYNTFEYRGLKYIGIFNVGQVEGKFTVDLEDGRYRNCLNRKMINVVNGKIDLVKYPIVIKLKKN